MRNYYTLNKSTNNGHLDFVGNMTNIKPNDVSIIFFEDETVNTINKILIELVKEETLKRYGRRISIMPQNKNHLLTIMRYVYFKNIKNDGTVEEQVKKLIDKTIESMFPTVIQGLVSHIKYINSYNNNSFMKPNILPELVNNKENKQLGQLGQLPFFTQSPLTTLSTSEKNNTLLNKVCN